MRVPTHVRRSRTRPATANGLPARAGAGAGANGPLTHAYDPFADVNVPFADVNDPLTHVNVRFALAQHRGDSSIKLLF